MQEGLLKIADPRRHFLSESSPRAAQSPYQQSVQQAKDGHSVRSSDEDLAVDDQRRDELVAVAEVIAPACGLVAVVKLIQIRGVVSVQRGGRRILDSPHNAVRGSIRAYCRGGAGILERVRAMKRSRCREFGVGDRKRLQSVVDCAIVHGVVELGGHRPDPTDRTVDFLVESAVVICVELAHIIAIDDVDFLILPCPDGEMLYRS